MVWTIDYTDTARTQLRKLDKQTAKRILDFLDERVAGRADPSSTGKALTCPLGGALRTLATSGPFSPAGAVNFQENN